MKLYVITCPESGDAFLLDYPHLINWNEEDLKYEFSKYMKSSWEDLKSRYNISTFNQETKTILGWKSL